MGFGELQGMWTHLCAPGRRARHVGVEAPGLTWPRGSLPLQVHLCPWQAAEQAGGGGSIRRLGGLETPEQETLRERFLF